MKRFSLAHQTMDIVITASRNYTMILYNLYDEKIFKDCCILSQYIEDGAILVPLSILSDKIVFPVESGGFPVCLS